MPNNTLKLSELITKCRQRTDMTNSGFISDVEIVGYINLAMADLHDILVTSYEDYYINQTDYTLPLTDGTRALPDSFYKVLGVDISMSSSFDSGSVTYRVRPYSFQERDAYSNPVMVSARTTNTFYNIRGNNIYFIPDPTVAAKARLYWVPEATFFASTGSGWEDQQIKTVAPAVAVGWEEFIILSVCIKMVMKEEGDPGNYYRLLKDVRERLTNVAKVRDPGESKAIRDVSVGTLQQDYINWL